MAYLSGSTDVQGSLSSNTDHDWYRVYLTTGARYRIDMEKATSSPRLDPYLALRDENGKVVSENDDISWSNNNAAISYTPKATGNYYIDAGSYDNNTYGDFTLRFHSTPTLL
jgi:serralysin